MRGVLGDLIDQMLAPVVGVVDDPLEGFRAAFGDQLVEVDLLGPLGAWEDGDADAATSSVERVGCVSGSISARAALLSIIGDDHLFGALAQLDELGQVLLAKAHRDRGDTGYTCLHS